MRHTGHISLTTFVTLGCLSSFVLECADGPISVDNALSTSGISFGIDLANGGNVAAIRFEVTRVPCDGEEIDPLTAVATEDLDDLQIPGGVTEIEGVPFDAQSSHYFADHFFVLPVGCYDVTAQPVDDEGQPECSEANETGVEVDEGQTTEIVLVSQCPGPSVGGLDVIGVLNFPPEVTNLTYEPSKFSSVCDRVRICATASDPDNDPLRFLWEQTDADGPEVTIEFDEEIIHDDGSVTQCVFVSSTVAGTYNVTVTVWDLVPGQGPGGFITVEEWFLNTQNEVRESRDSLEVPVHFLPDEQCGELNCPPVEVVFFMDTSPSMDDEGAALCDNLDAVVDSLEVMGISVTPETLNIVDGTGIQGCGTYPCLTDSVGNVYGTAVPGSPPAGLETLGGDCPGFPQLPCEDWGRATAIVAGVKAWQAGSVRIVVPISDEGPWCGSPVSDLDDDSIAHATTVALDNSVVVSPISGTGANSEVIGLAEQIAGATGGTHFNSVNPPEDLAEAIRDLVIDACVAAGPPAVN